MQITVRQPNLEKFIAEQLHCGRFDSAEELVEAALHHMMSQQSEKSGFNEATIAAILKADAQCDRGEGMELGDAASLLRKRVSTL
jgi:Arc/MetJ-type ribon-helix-helix transcriptional regulator